jgi:hypothetical protein
MSMIPRGKPGARRMVSTVCVAAATLTLIGLATPANAATSINTSASAAEIAQAMDGTGSDGVVTSAAFEEIPPEGTPNAVVTSDPPLASFPTDGQSFGLMTTGNAALADDPNDATSSGANDNGPTPTGRGDSAFDVSILQVDLKVPEWASCLRIDFRFLSEEFPEYVGSTFNDAFIAELDPTTDPDAPASRRPWSTSGSEIMAPANFAFDPDGNPISINSTGFAHMTEAEAAGTAYDGATPILAAQTPITPGNHSVHLSIFDQGDHVYDSAVFLDKLELGTQTGEGCREGAQPLANLSLSVSPTTAPAGFDEMPKDAMDYAALSSVQDGAGTTLATSPISRGPISRGPISRGPISRGPISRGPISRGGIVDADPGFLYAPLQLLPLAHVDPIPITQVPMVEPPGPWSAVLPSDLAAQPPQTVTVQGFATTGAASAVRVADLDLSDSSVASLSPASLLLGNATLSQLGLGSGGQPLALFESQGGSVATLDVASMTLADRAPALSGSLISGMALRGIEWETTDGWNVAVSDLPAAARAAILECPAGGCGSETLGEARGNDHLRPDATVGDLLSNLGTASVLHGETFGGLLPGIIDVENFPFDRAPLSEILEAAAIDPGNLVTYEAAADVPCPLPDSETPARFTVTLPGHGFRYAPETGEVRIGDSETPSSREPSISGRDLTWEVTDAETCAGVTGSQHVAIGFRVEPGPELGTFPSSLTVEAGTALSILDQAPLTTTENFEANDSPQTAAPISLDTLYTNTLADGGDTEYFRLGGFDEADGGRTLQVSVTHLPGQDYDVIMYGAESAASETLRGAPISRGPISRGPISRGPLLDDAQCAPPGTVLEPQTMQDVPQVNQTGFEIRSYSTNRSTGNEFACTVIRPSDIGEAITIQVTGYNGSSSASPAVVSAQMSAPVTPLPCVPVPSTPGTAGPSLPAPGTVPPSTQTLFLVPSEAIGRFHGTAAEDDVLGAVTDPAFLTMPNVQGAVLSVDRDADVAAAYSAWYGDYCSPETANEVVREINRLVDSYRNTGAGLPNLRHIVLVGSDAVLPFARIPDMVSLGNESAEAANVQFDGKDNPTSRALSLGYFLSDDPFYSFQPLPWITTELYPPSVAGGRLGETPEDIVDAIETYRLFNGILDPKTEFTTGYDFFADAAQEKETILHARYDHPRSGSNTYQSQINEAWTKSDLANALNARPGIVATDAHADHYRLMPAAAFHAQNVTDADLYATNDLVASALADGTLAMSIGCHAGLSVADVWVTGADPATLDWAQGFAQKGSLLQGNTGFGYGDTEIVAYTEKLTVAVSDNLDGSMSVGQAVSYAKQQYYSGLGAWGVFDAKSVQQFTQYGLPMYVVGASGRVAGPVPPTSPPPTSEDPDTGLQATTLSFATLNSGAVDTGRGVYYEGPTGLVQAEHYRPIQPITEPQDLTQTPGRGLRLHGGALLSFDVTDIEGFRAALSIPTLAPEALQPSPAFKDASFPSGFVSTLSQDTVFGPRDSLVVFGGQFISDPGGPPNTGTQRLFSDATVRAYYSPSDVFSVGIFSTIDATDLGNTARFEVTSPSEGIAAMYVTFRRAGGSEFTSQRLTPDPDGVWRGTVDTSQSKVQEYFVQMVMDTGDVSVSTFKALLFPKPEPPPPDPSAVVVGVTDAGGASVGANEFGWYRRSPLTVSVTSRTETFTASVDGGPTQPSPVTVAGDGQHQVDYQGSGGTMGRAEIPIDTLAPVVSPCPGPAQLLLNQDGGMREVAVTAADPDPGTGPREIPSGINEAGSVLSAVIDTTMPGTTSVNFSARDYAGNASSKTCSYGVRYGFSGFFTPVDNPPTVNVVRAGQGVPINWRLVDANGVGISDPASFLGLSVLNTAGECSGPSDALETYTGASGLRYLGDGNWTFNWQTPKSYAGKCKTAILRLADGLVPAPGEPRTAHFRFK